MLVKFYKKCFKIKMEKYKRKYGWIKSMIGILLCLLFVIGVGCMNQMVNEGVAVVDDKHVEKTVHNLK